MEHQFKRRQQACLETAIREVRNMELTQEIKLPDAMPDIGQILCAWGQPVLRGKEWRSDSISCSAGLMVWVLYTPEDGGPAQCIEGWIPFQMRWDLPENVPEGTIRIHCISRFVDARSVSARKILVRAGTAAQAEAFVPRILEFWEPEISGETDTQLLQTQWPLRLPVEAGERSFVMDEEAEPSGLPAEPEKIISFHLEPKLTEKRVLGNKLVFRGTGYLHSLCRCTDGQLHSWDVEVPFSQFAQLQGEYGQDALCDICLSATSMEPELGENGRLRFKGGLVAQYLVTDRKMVTVAQDAYNPDREVQLQMETVQVPAVLDFRRENIYAEQTIPAEVMRMVEIGILPDFPRQHPAQDGVELEMPGQIQLLYYGTDGSLRAGTARWEGKISVPAGENTRLLVSPGIAEEPKMTQMGGQISLGYQIPVEITAVTNQAVDMIAGLELKELRKKDPDRPSLILRKAGEERLWEIAKACGTTTETIRRINGLTAEPAPDRLLIIPVS